MLLYAYGFLFFGTVKGCRIREGNRSQLPGMAPVIMSYDQPEFICLQCERHSRVRGVIAVFNNPRYAFIHAVGASI